MQILSLCSTLESYDFKNQVVYCSYVFFELVNFFTRLCCAVVEISETQFLFFFLVTPEQNFIFFHPYPHLGKVLGREPSTG